MANIDPYISNEIKGAVNPITWAGTNKDNIQQVIDLVSPSSTQPDEHRGYFDEMTPACRITLLRVLTDLKTAVENV